MNSTKKHNFITKFRHLFLFLFLFIIITPASADLLFPVGSPLWVIPLLFANYILNLFILAIIFAILKVNYRGAYFLVYSLIVTVGGFLIDLGVVSFSYPNFELGFALIFIFLMVFNSLLVRVFYKPSRMKCFAIGFVMGFLTNPFLILILMS